MKIMGEDFTIKGHGPLDAGNSGGYIWSNKTPPMGHSSLIWTPNASTPATSGETDNT